MIPGVFVIGTDTEIGKTHVASALVRALVLAGCRTVGFKPVGSGAGRHPEGHLEHPDALALQAVSHPRPMLQAINPYAFEPPISPHLAAERAGVVIEMDTLRARVQALAADYQFIVGEGAGGLRVPLGPQLDTVDLIRDLKWPCILVVGLKLGCLNHARLTAEALQSHRLPWLGWVANAVDPEYASDAGNQIALETYLDGPCLGRVSFGPDVDQAAGELRRLALVLVSGLVLGDSAGSEGMH